MSKSKRYVAHKFVSKNKEHEWPVATADTVERLMDALVRLDDWGYFNVYDRQPPDPDKEAEKVGGITVEDGKASFERTRAR